MLSVVIVASIALAIYLGYKTKLNTGFFCIVFAYLIGCLGMGLTPKTLIGYWPTSIMFVILGVSLFYNVAAANGTLEALSHSLLYTCRRFPGLLPYALFVVAVILSVMGAAYFTVLAFLAPITMLVCTKTHMDKLTGAVAINCGALAGGDFPTAALGVIFRGLMDAAYAATPDLVPLDTFVSTLMMFGLSMGFGLIVVTLFRYGIKSNRNIGQGVAFDPPAPYTQQQKETLTLIFLMMAVVLAFPILKLITGNAFIGAVASKLDVGLVAVVFAVAALWRHLASEKEVVKNIPWSTILMIAGAGMLIGVAVQAKTIALLSAWIGEDVSVFLVPFAFSVVASIMSFFSSTTGVVCPALFPLIPGLAEATGLSAQALFSCTVLGAQSSAISPFSSGGSLILSAAGSDEERDHLFQRLMFVAVPVNIGICALYNFLVSMVL